MPSSPQTKQSWCNGYKITDINTNTLFFVRTYISLALSLLGYGWCFTWIWQQISSTQVLKQHRTSVYKKLLSYLGTLKKCQRLYGIFVLSIIFCSSQIDFVWLHHGRATRARGMRGPTPVSLAKWYQGLKTGMEQRQRANVWGYYGSPFAHLLLNPPKEGNAL